MALIEEKLDVPVSSELAESVLRGSLERQEGGSLERLEGEISERADGIATGLTENELREFRGLLDLKIPTVEQQREGGITVEKRLDDLEKEETYWKELAEEQKSNKQRLYETKVNVAALKGDYMRLRTNRRPRSELVQNIVEEEAENNNDVTRFERFKE